MFSKATKNLLRSTIRQTDHYNRFMEEGDMWRTREEQRQRRKREARRPRQAHMDGSDSDSSVMRRDGEAEVTPGCRDNKRSSYWMRELVKAEEEHGDRWGHSGYQQMYPEDFVSSYSSSDEEPSSKKPKKSKKKSKDKKKKSKKSKKKKKHKTQKSDHSDKSDIIGPLPACEQVTVESRMAVSRDSTQDSDARLPNQASAQSQVVISGDKVECSGNHSKKSDSDLVRKRRKRRSKFTYSSSSSSSSCEDEMVSRGHKEKSRSSRHEEKSRSSHKSKHKKLKTLKHSKHRHENKS